MEAIVQQLVSVEKSGGTHALEKVSQAKGTKSGGAVEANEPYDEACTLGRSRTESDEQLQANYRGRFDQAIAETLRNTHQALRLWTHLRLLAAE